MSAIKSRVPDTPDTDPAMKQFLDSMDRRQLRMGQAALLGAGATNDELIAKINELIESHKTR